MTHSLRMPFDIGNQGIVGPGDICWGDACFYKGTSTPVEHDDVLGLCVSCKTEILGSTVTSKELSNTL